MKTIAIVQARMGSSRFPNKVMRPIAGTPMIELLFKRLAKSRHLNQIILATSTDPRNDPLAAHIEALGYACWRGSEQDVLERYLQAARAHKADVIVRITGDCPLIDPQLVDAVIDHFKQSGADYASTGLEPSFPDGLDTEVFTLAALEQSALETDAAFDHEHVTPWLRQSGHFKIAGFTHPIDYSQSRWTVDEAADFAVVSAIFAHFAPDIHFPWQAIIELEKNQPEIFAANRNIIPNEGAFMGSGQKLWKRAKQIIPGGNMLLSKRAEMFLPDQWPAYFSKAKGAMVWDMDGKAYIDMSIMGIGTNTLGYGHDEVDASVMQTITNGNMSTLNCPEEVWLAEKLIEINPWADMVRLARSGGEANAIAIRIARAASGRDKVAICGYHGWHDWYLSANLGDDENLAGHLLPGLEPAGVPKNLRGTVLPFNYNDFAGLQKLIDQNPDVGVIKMEVSRNKGPEDGFLQKIRELASARGIVLIFDECTSGFRESFGGLNKNYGVEPDIAMFGKAMGNGYAITAIVGRRAVMEAAQTTFISSTFWTERIGPTAALKTLEVMQREKSWEIITAIGQNVRSLWQQLADHHGLKISHWGLPALAGFTIESAQAQAYKTLITQEMLAKGYLASNSLYAAIVHTPEIIDGYIAALDPIFGLIRECEDGRDVMSLLKGPLCHQGFRRLN